MAGWLTRLGLALIALGATGDASSAVLAATAETRATELLVTCLSCGEQWLFSPTTTVAAGLLSLFSRRKLADKCPECGSRAVKFGHPDAGGTLHQGAGRRCCAGVCVGGWVSHGT